MLLPHYFRYHKQFQTTLSQHYDTVNYNVYFSGHFFTCKVHFVELTTLFAVLCAIWVILVFCTLETNLKSKKKSCGNQQHYLKECSFSISKSIQCNKATHIEVCMFKAFVFRIVLYIK